MAKRKPSVPVEDEAPGAAKHQRSDRSAQPSPLRDATLKLVPAPESALCQAPSWWRLTEPAYTEAELAARGSAAVCVRSSSGVRGVYKPGTHGAAAGHQIVQCKGGAFIAAVVAEGAPNVAGRIYDAHSALVHVLNAPAWRPGVPRVFGDVRQIQKRLNHPDLLPDFRADAADATNADAPARPRGACAVCGEVHLAFRTLADMESFKASVPALKNARLKF